MEKDNNVTAKELKKSPFEENKSYDKELKAIQSILDKHAKDINGCEKVEEDFLKLLLNSKDPISTWIKANVLDDLGYPEFAIQFKIRAQELGYAVTDVNEQNNIENYMISMNAEFKTKEELDNFKEELEEELEEVDSKNVNIQTSTSMEQTNENLENNSKKIITGGEFVGQECFIIDSDNISNNEVQEYLVRLENSGEKEWISKHYLSNIDQTNENSNNKTGLKVYGRTQIDNNKISDFIEHSDFYGEWNWEGYFFFPEDESTLDELESELTKEFDNLDIYARFENSINEGQEFMYQSRELTPWNIFSDEKENKEKTFNPYAVQNMLQHDMMMKFAYDHLNTGNFEEDMQKLYDTYIKNDEDMLDKFKQYEKYVVYICESQNQNDIFAHTIYDILEEYGVDISDEPQLSTIINKIVTNLVDQVNYSKQTFALYTPDVKNAIVEAFNDLTVIDIIEKFKRCDVKITDFNKTNDQLSQKLDDEFGMPSVALNFISSVFQQTKLQNLEFIRNGEISTILLMTNVALVLKEISNSH